MRSLALVALAACHGEDAVVDPPAPMVVVQANTGTSEHVADDVPAGQGYDAAMAATSDAWYGDGLAWPPAIDALRAWLDEQRADVVAFQEIFDVAACASIPADARVGFVCEGFVDGDPTVPERVLGDGWQVGCFPGHPDKCVAVRRAFGTFDGCDGDRCDRVVAGFQVDGCGKGARVGRVRVTRADGAPLTVVGLHGTSGISADEQACRVAQFEQAFVDLGDGAPGADGSPAVVLGDVNTDPGRATEVDASARRLVELVDGDPYRFVTDVGPDATPTYGGLVNIDHVVTDGLDGDCVHPGVTPGAAAVLDAPYFDHVPVTCALR